MRWDGCKALTSLFYVLDLLHIIYSQVLLSIFCVMRSDREQHHTALFTLAFSATTLYNPKYPATSFYNKTQLLHNKQININLIIINATVSVTKVFPRTPYDTISLALRFLYWIVSDSRFSPFYTHGSTLATTSYLSPSFCSHLSTQPCPPGSRLASKGKALSRQTSIVSTESHPRRLSMNQKMTTGLPSSVTLKLGPLFPVSNKRFESVLLRPV